MFTPSLLTILGVIMYLRLPWIVAQGGLYFTIIIIIVAHVVSVTTGLSVASIATDKKVQAGGNYYIISRSLGLPIGGTLGLALFVGLAFSISLYIIGFTESLLSVLELAITKETIRIYGSIALVALTIIVFISTSLAIKTQYLILAAVFLSLISIFLGGSALPADQFVLNPVENHESLFVIFGIFFPAVTGFTAGVQMSGDLKDPKKSIPLGTIASIAVGFIVYIALAIFVSFNVSSDKLINNPNILANIAYIPQLVVAGIWGAALSSAMGSILGAPRILQATSRDKVTPKFFGKGYGASNEPRRALIFTFFLAEAGILIGDLNAIARLVSIFFLSTYGLINLSYALESWASADFRPSFKVPVWVGVLGTIVCAVLMFELDVLAFTAAIIVLMLLYLYLKRKELTLETGDTWGSFWSSVVRSGLQRLHSSVEHKRNWRPNILLFRGSAESRKHLLSFGKWFAGKTGIISDFELIESSKDTLKLTKSAQLVHSDDVDSGIFNRRFECRDIYSGVEAVAQFYGFSGVEPNTILLGWPRNTKNPEKVVSLLNNLTALDYNILLLDKNKDEPFESFKSIDIWWRGGSNNAALALALMRFMHASSEWKEAQLRILIIVDDSAMINKVHSNMQRILQELRQEAQVKVINNAIEQRSFREIMMVESATTDLTIIGLPELKPGDADFVKKTNGFIYDLNSVLLISASSYFEPYYIGIERRVEQHIKSNLVKAKEDYRHIKLPDNEILAKKLDHIHEQINYSINEFYSGYIVEIEQSLKKLGNEIKFMVENQFQFFTKKMQNIDTRRLLKAISRTQSDTLYNSWRFLISYQENELNRLQITLEQGIENIISRHTDIINETPESLLAYFTRENAAISISDPLSLKIFKVKKRILHRLFKKEISLPVKLRMFMRHHINGFLRKQLLQQLLQIGYLSYNSISRLQKNSNRIQDLFKNLEITVKESGTLEIYKLNMVRETINNLFADYDSFVESEFNNAVDNFASVHQKSFQNKLTHFDSLNINNKIKKQFRLKKIPVDADTFVVIPERWRKNMSWMIDFTGMELIVLLFENRLTVLLKKWIEDLELRVSAKLKASISRLEQMFMSVQAGRQDKQLKKFNFNIDDYALLAKTDTIELTKEVQDSIQELPEKVEVMNENSFHSLKENQFEEQEIVSVYLRKMIGYLIDTEFLYDLNEKVNEFNQRVKDAVMTIEDTQRLLVSTITTSQETESELQNEAADVDLLFRRGLQRLAESKENVHSAFMELTTFAGERLETSFDKMNPYLITNSSNNLKQYIFSHEQRRVISRLDQVKLTTKGFLQKVAVNFQYSQSEGILFARKLNRMAEAEKSSIDRMISLTRAFSPNNHILDLLPRYYKQLYIGEGSISRQFLVSRNKSIQQAERIIQRYNEGYKGALLIKGDPRSGKTALSRMISSRHFDRKKVYRVNPLAGGSINTDTFTQRLNEATHITGNLDQIFEKLAPKSAIIINDLEMWWERSEQGNDVIELILQLIDKYSEKVLFIINANPHFLKLINNMQSIERSFVGIISCELFSAKEIETAILQRHRSTGIKFQLNNRLESEMSDFRMAGLFNEIFKFSKGSIGVALLSWLSMIKKYSTEVINISKLKKPDLNIIADLETEWQIWITQFLLHKQLNKTRLVRVFRSEEKYINQLSEALLRSGFIVKGNNESLKINPYIEHLFIEKFSQLGLLWNNS